MVKKTAGMEAWFTETFCEREAGACAPEMALCFFAARVTADELEAAIDSVRRRFASSLRYVSLWPLDGAGHGASEPLAATDAPTLPNGYRLPDRGVFLRCGAVASTPWALIEGRAGVLVGLVPSPARDILLEDLTAALLVPHVRREPLALWWWTGQDDGAVARIRGHRGVRGNASLARDLFEHMLERRMPAYLRPPPPSSFPLAVHWRRPTDGLAALEVATTAAAAPPDDKAADRALRVWLYARYLPDDAYAGDLVAYDVQRRILGHGRDAPLPSPLLTETGMTTAAWAWYSALTAWTMPRLRPRMLPIGAILKETPADH